MLAESLVGLDGIVHQGALLMARILEVDIKKTELFVSSITTGSYTDNFLVRFIFGKGKKGEENIEKLRKALGLKDMELSKLTVLAIGVMVVYAAWTHVHRTPDHPANIHIENSFNNWGRELGLTREELLAAIESSVTNKEGLRRDASRLLHPAKTDTAGPIRIDDGSAVDLPAEIAAAVPARYEPGEPEEPTEDMERAETAIRALDLDKAEAGWAAIVPSVSDKRLPIHLGEGIDPMTVPVGKYCVADLTVVYQVTKTGARIPKRYILKRIIVDASE